MLAPTLSDTQPYLFEIQQDTYESGVREAADTILSLAEFCMEFSEVTRIPRYRPGHRENDVEHSFMGALVGYEFCRKYYHGYDAGLVVQYLLVHDMIEWKDRKDIPTFLLTNEEARTKTIAEQDELPAVVQRLPRYLGDLLLRYEAQVEPEAILANMIDKLLPVAVDILGPGKQVMTEDYGIFDRAGMDVAQARLSSRLRAKLPQPELQPLHYVRDVLAAEFADQYSY
ncbi:MAG TPA: HD domain-containing protein [Candidatus Saccharimonadales bacterium]|jgi:5'-deoxynucleotidase YfbR-like HD superfamily hydrolase